MVIIWSFSVSRVCSISSKFTQVRFTKVYLSKFISAYEKVRINYVRTLLA